MEKTNPSSSSSGNSNQGKSSTNDGTVNSVQDVADQALKLGGHRTTREWLTQDKPHRTPGEWWGQGNHRSIGEWLSGKSSRNKK